MKKPSCSHSFEWGEYGHYIIQQKLKTILEKEKSVLKNNDTEALHEMRVAMRGLEAAIQLFKPALNLPKKTNSTSIGKMSGRLGKYRDLDVLQNALTTRYQPLLQADELVVFKQVVKSMQQVRDQDWEKLKKSLKGKRYHDLINSVHEWVKKPSYSKRGKLPLVEILPDLLWQAISPIFVHPGWQIGRLGSGKNTLTAIEDVEIAKRQLVIDGDVLHDLRKAMKSVRYQAEFFTGYYNDAYRDSIEEFKTIQELLGQFHDRIVLRQYLESTLQTEWVKILPSVDKLMRHDDTIFYKKWHAMQQRFQSPGFQQALKALLYAPANPVLPSA